MFEYLIRDLTLEYIGFERKRARQTIRHDGCQEKKGCRMLVCLTCYDYAELNSLVDSIEEVCEIFVTVDSCSWSGVDQLESWA